MSPESIQKLAAIRGNLQAFSAHCLKVAPKDPGPPVPFVWNEAQHLIHKKLEEQLKDTGKVRAIICKGRQQGCSTYVAARFYHKTSMNEGRRAFIVSHEAKSTSNLFGIVKMYNTENPLAPTVEASNAQELKFGALNSGYKLATAGTENVGRGNTAQLLHGSEIGYWKNAHMHFAGIGNSVPNADGTEVIFESTANGVGNTFHVLWSKSEEGVGLYRPIFVPWYLSREYRSLLRSGFAMTADDEDYMRTYDLDLEQMQWRADKIAEYDEGQEWLFDREYPAIPQLAFRVSTGNSLVNPSRVMRAVASRFRDPSAPLVIGVDPAGDGASTKDRTAIVFRRGRMVERCEYHEKLNTMQIAGKLASYWAEFSPDGMIIDKGGLGAGIYDRLIELNIQVIGIMYGAAADDSTLYANKKAEIWHRMKEWFEDEPVRIPNDQALISDITAPQPDTSSNGRKAVESKESLEKRQIRSPDGADALANTFAVAITHKMHGTSGRRSSGAATNAGY